MALDQELEDLPLLGSRLPEELGLVLVLKRDKNLRLGMHLFLPLSENAIGFVLMLAVAKDLEGPPAVGGEEILLGIVQLLRTAAEESEEHVLDNVGGR